MKSINASSGHGVGNVILHFNQRDFLGIIESLQMTASSSINSHIYLIGNDESHGYITVEGGDLSANERNIDRQTHTHHTCRIFSGKSPKLFSSIRI